MGRYCQVIKNIFKMFNQISCLSFAMLVLRNALFVSGNSIYPLPKTKDSRTKSYLHN
jgi:hypothetical protein